MDKRGLIEWRIVWIIIVVATAVVVILIFFLLYYVSSTSQSPFSFFSNLLGGF